MRPKYIPPATLGRQLDEWRQPLNAAPDLDEAVARMLVAIDRRQQREQESSDQKV